MYKYTRVKCECLAAAGRGIWGNWVCIVWKYELYHHGNVLKG